MDVRVAEGTEEVQNGEVESENWMLEQRKARKKSKTGKLVTWIGR